MRARFSKMQGAGNDFVVFDAVRQSIPLARVDWRRLADRHFGIGADQILVVEPPEQAAHDFRFRIFNADGEEVEQCGNGARCFVRFVHEQGLSAKTRLLVETRAGVIAPELAEGGEVVVDMGPPRFDMQGEGFVVEHALAPHALASRGRVRSLELALPVPVAFTAALPSDPGPDCAAPTAPSARARESVVLDLLSMGNPHAVLWLAHPAEDALVESLGPVLSLHPAFAQGSNIGFACLDRARAVLHLRVFERGAGETLACGSGACAAAVLAIEHALTGSPLQVQARGGKLCIDWPGGDAHVRMQGPAETVFGGEIELPLR